MNTENSTEITLEDFNELQDLSFSDFKLPESSRDLDLLRIKDKLFNDTIIRIEGNWRVEGITIENCSGTSLTVVIGDSDLEYLTIKNTFIECLTIITENGAELCLIDFVDSKSETFTVNIYNSSRDFYFKLKGTSYINNFDIKPVKVEKQSGTTYISQQNSQSNTTINNLNLKDLLLVFEYRSHIESVVIVNNIKLINCTLKDNPRLLLEEVSFNLNTSNTVLGIEPNFTVTKSDFKTITEVLKTLPKTSSLYKVSEIECCTESISDIRRTLGKIYRESNTYLGEVLDSEYIYWLHGILGNYNSSHHLTPEDLESINERVRGKTFEEVYECYKDSSSIFKIRIKEPTVVAVSKSSGRDSRTLRYTTKPYVNLPPRQEVTSGDFDSFDPGDFVATDNTTQSRIDIFREFRPRTPPVVPEVIDRPTRTGTSARAQVAGTEWFADFIATDTPRQVWIDEDVRTYNNADVNSALIRPLVLERSHPSTRRSDTSMSIEMEAIQRVAESLRSHETVALSEDPEFIEMLRSSGVRSSPTPFQFTDYPPLIEPHTAVQASELQRARSRDLNSLFNSEADRPTRSIDIFGDSEE